MMPEPITQSQLVERSQRFGIFAPHAERGRGRQTFGSLGPSLLSAALRNTTPEQVRAMLAAGSESPGEITEDLDGRCRMLTAQLVADIYDFSDERMLEASVPLAQGLTMFRDHSLSVGNWIGKTYNAVWDPGEEGRKPGINTQFWIDHYMAGGDVIRGMLRDVLNRFSVTVEFDYERSHPDLDSWQFWSMLGEEVEGEVVRFIVTKVLGYYELSVVWFGADPDAKSFSLGSTQLHRPDVPSSAHREESEVKTLAELVAGEPAAEKELKTLTAKAARVEELEKQNTELSAHREKQLKALFDRGVKALSASLGAPEAEVLQADVHYQALKRALENEDESYLVALTQSHEVDLDKKLPLRCEECGSSAVSRRQSAPGDSGADGNGSDGANLSAEERNRRAHSRRLGKTLGGE